MISTTYFFIPNDDKAWYNLQFEWEYDNDNEEYDDNNEKFYS